MTPGDLLRETRLILRVAAPLMLAQGGLMTMGVMDTFVVGRVSPLDMAAVALGNGVAGLFIVFGVGLGMGIEPLVAQAHGARDPRRARHAMWQGLWLASLIAGPLTLSAWLSTFLFKAVGVPSEIADLAAAFLASRLPGIAFNCVYAVLRSYLSNIGCARPVLISVILANLLNAVLDVVLILGWFGSPRLGAVGCGWATSTAWAFMSMFLVFVIRRNPLPVGDGTVTHGFAKPDKKELRRIFTLGWPIGLQISLEVGVFTAVSTLVSRFGEAQLAGHQIAITLASATFMAAVGVAIATTAQVGFHIGAGDPGRARRSGFLGIGLGALFMAGAGLTFWIFATQLAGLFAPNQPAVVEIGATLLGIAAVFAVSDGVQAVAAGALRGAGDTRWPFYANLGAHWLLGLPIALYLGHVRGLGTAGYWWGLTAGLTGVAAILLARFHALSRRPIAPISISKTSAPW